MQEATAITRVFGDGMRLVAVRLTYRHDVDAAALDKAQFQVAERNITDISASGREVTLALNPDDAAALLIVKQGRPANKAGSAPAKNGPGKAGEKQETAPTLKPAEATVQIGSQTLHTQRVMNEVFDDFAQHQFADKATGETVRYNLFTPKNLAKNQRYPLVLFMHDAGVTGTIVKAPLYQGNGAIAWASPDFQATHPCFVLAPEYDEIIVDDTSTASNYLDASINLIKHLQITLPIDGKRLYTTGQSGGGMMSIAMNIKYPDFFAASYLVACQWNPELLTPQMKNVKWWITVSQDDAKAYPGELAITDKLAGFGAKVARADDWNAQWPAADFQAETFANSPNNSLKPKMERRRLVAKLLIKHSITDFSKCRRAAAPSITGFAKVSGCLRRQPEPMRGQQVPTLPRYAEYLPKLDKPARLADILDEVTAPDSPYIAVLIPGGHGAFNKLPESRDMQRLLDWALANDKFIITLCHGPAALAAAGVGRADSEFPFKGYESCACSPDALDEGANLDIGYMPGKLPWLLAKRLEELGMVVKNSKTSIAGSVHKDRRLLTGDSPLAGNALGILAADELLKAVGAAA
ncbi:hypothetical protein [Kingella oralis]|nr:hypothetical protein [Kingella oralis]